MKKLSILMLLMLSFGVMLTGCGNDADDVDNSDAIVVENTEVVVDDVDDEEIADRDEYQFEVAIKSADGVDMQMKIYKKGDNTMTEVVKMFAEEEMPFAMKKMLIVDGIGYQQVEKDGKEYRFSIPTDKSNVMFNLREMSTVDESIVKNTKKEKINGKKMVCYYVDDKENGEGKACLYKGVFMYGEFEEEGQKGIIEITDYDDDVSDKVFKLPSEDQIMAPEDMMQLFQ